MHKTKAGIGTGLLATFSLSEVSIWVGLIATLLTGFFLLPGCIIAWRKLVGSYFVYSKQSGKSGVIVFILYCVGFLRPITETKNPFNND